MKEIIIGSAKNEPGKLTYGFFDGIDLPTGIIEKIPVMIAQGTKDGPTMFLTANIHGSELTGIAVIHDLVTETLTRELKGTVVAIPTLNPSGLRHLKRSPEYDDLDPNRLFPDGKFADDEDKEDEESKYPKPFAQIAETIYSYMEKYADLNIDFHNHNVHSIPFVILDRIFYKRDDQKEEAEQLFTRMNEMVETFGMTICAEHPAKEYLKKKYHRSVSGAALNNIGIPAFTAELGSNMVIDPEALAGSIKAVRNVLKWAGMLEGPREEITEFKILKSSERIRFFNHPRAKHSGIIRYLVKPGDQVTKGQPIAKIMDILGRPLGDGYVRTDHDGYIIGLNMGVTIYRNDTIATMGIKDDAALVVQIPKKN